uniref:Predicted protein n=1 Tax=Hordeum vulgare subsp. vulgare TaxID=112509 RepID=F2E0V6_HORVV|nr:predicted protein [Hordeum vulgare subsp. vulgare]
MLGSLALAYCYLLFMMFHDFLIEDLRRWIFCSSA